ncbi:sodium:solute symporter [Aliishimia ponticola]|uniref:histidine kinase n=1 Tax=Aliishimia ponticola TaxID=2499833 RepID=A0A4S4NPC7_9RHOB|nr:sensor histidine kinase [Aliishimia ponticola]THH38080.1 sodium:solute symporter [Aliishimia ponticola]
MTTLNSLVLVCLAYVAFLFAVAFAAERAAVRGSRQWLRAPLIYTLSLSIYCTAWTFYGAVGYAARSGMEFVTIYLGPSLVMFGWLWVLRKLVRIGRTHKVTSIADLISSRFGKSNTLAVLVTLVAVIGVTPYIALQLQSVTLSLAIFAELDPGGEPLNKGPAAFWISFGLILFTMLFGTRNLNANERQHGIVIAIAVEAVVKLVALLAVGAFVVWGMAGGVGEMMQRIDQSSIAEWRVERGRWATVTFLAAAAFLCLPRMFQVLVVENDDDRQLETASWLFPLYLFAMSLFVVPIAVMGLEMLPESNPDLYVLTLPLLLEKDALAVLAFLGGFSSATSMVIVASLALATMVSNHIVMPIWLSLHGEGASVSGDVRHVVITARRLSIMFIIGLGYIYFRISGGSAALASIGMISFAGVAQFLPAMIGGIFWRGGTRAGALAAVSVGFVIWVWTMLLPSFGAGGLLTPQVLAEGPWGIRALRPQALFGFEALDSTVHAVWWSLSLNFLTFWCVSIFTFPRPLERLQGAQMVNVFDRAGGTTRGWSATAAQSEDLLIMAQRILGPEEARTLFRQEASAQGYSGNLPDPSPEFLQKLERELAAAVGAATAHAMIGQIAGGPGISVEDLIAVADESAQILEYSNQIEAKSAELSRTARQLKEANTKLKKLSVQKDAFLSQISHELRTPMTSIRAFSEILRDTDELAVDEKTRFASIIHDEAIRLTRLLDDLLDLSVLENGQVTLNRQVGSLETLLNRAVQTVQPGGDGPMKIIRRRINEQVLLQTDLDRLTQVFINLVSNAQKYCAAPNPRLTIQANQTDTEVTIDFIDNGTGISEADQALIFEKFSRLGDSDGSGAGLGLAICAEIMERLGGSIRYLPGTGGTGFRVTLPKVHAMAAQ